MREKRENIGKRSLVILLGLVTVSLLSLTAKGQYKTISPFSLSDVRLLDGPFRQAEQTALSYILALEPDRLLAPYLREAGLSPKAESYGNWEITGLDGHTAGHYLTALAQMWAATGNQEALRRLTYMLQELKRCQEKIGTGYIGGVPDGQALWQEIAGGKIEADNFSLNGKWVPWYNLHKLFAGLRDAYQLAGSQEARQMLVALSGWSLQLVSGLSDAQLQQMLITEPGGMNEVFADVYAITGEQKYLELAQKFSHQQVLDPLLQQRDALTGLHANTQIPKVVGFKRIAELGGAASWHEASRFFWETVARHRSVAIGGNSVREHFHPADDFMPMILDREGPETCNTYNMLKLSRMLYTSSSRLEYLEFYERGLYNHILSSQHPQKGGFVYFTPMRPQHYRVYSQPQENFWCCVGSGLENHGKYGELIYAHSNETLFVNLFIASELKWKERGLSLRQETRFPEEEKTRLVFDMPKPSRFVLKIRYPDWVTAGALRLTVNGKLQQLSVEPGSYISLERKWKKGDQVVVQLPMQTRLEPLPDGSPYAAVLHGPLVLAAKTGSHDLKGLYADDSRMGHIASGPLVALHEAPFLVSTGQNTAAQITPLPGRPLRFQAAGLIHQSHYKQLVLEPFYGIHDARYVLYWPLVAPHQVDSVLQANRLLEAAKTVLDALTIDQVAPGEQQPEADHAFKGERSESGIHQNRHWRHAEGWFSYELWDAHRVADRLQITYWGQDRDRNFDILINNTLIATVRLQGDRGAEFFTIDYPIPVELVKNAPDGRLRTEFRAHPGSIAGGIYAVRLLRKK